MPRRVLSEILQPRAEEICHLLWDEIRRAGYEKSLNSGIVLTGGGAMLEGMAEIAEQIFDLPVRRAAPEGVGGLADHVNNPAFATSVGLVRLHASQPASRAGARWRRCARPDHRTTPHAVQRIFLERARDRTHRRTARHFDIPTVPTSSEFCSMRSVVRAGARIKVIGVGGGGGNAVNRMVHRRPRRRRVHRRQHRPAGAAATTRRRSRCRSARS